MKRIKVKHRKTNELFEFICFSKEDKYCFVYRLHVGEELMEYGFIHAFQPVGMSWDELREYEDRVH